MSKPAQSISTLIFDIGGVLVELGEFPIKPQWQRETSGHDLTQWLKSEIAQAFEKGEISPAEFGDRFIRENDLQVSTKEFLAHFEQWPKGLYPDVIEALMQLRSKVTLGVFSNTNELHWGRLMHEMGLEGKFDHYFASHLLGFAKPDIEAFQMLCQRLEVSPESILFLDDSPVNIAAAKNANWQARQVDGFADACEILKEFRLL